MIFKFLIFLVGFIFAGAHFTSYSDFLKAVEEGQTHKVETLLATANIAAYDNQAIRLASTYGNLDIVKLLLARPEVNPGAIDNQAMVMAAKYGHTEIVRLLLAHPRVNPSINGGRAVLFASERGHADIVKLFINDGRANLDIFSFHTLERAAHFENVELLQFLLQYPYFHRIGPLVFKRGDLGSIKTMVAAGFKIDLENLEKTLQDARSSGNNDLVAYLETLKENFEPTVKPLITMTEQCAICLSDENLLDGYMTSCQHQFHTDCLQEWIAKHNTCPICRSII